MRRNSFFKAFGILIATPFIALDHLWANMVTRRDHPGFWVRAGKDRFEKPITLFEGDTFYTKLSSKDTDGAQYMYESTRTKIGGPSLHYHYDQDETWYVLEGTFSIRVGETIYEAKVGDTVFGPRKVPHSFSKTGDGVGKLLMSFQPAGKMEEFFKLVASGKLKDLTPGQQQQARKEHGFELIGAGVGYEKKF